MTENLFWTFRPPNAEELKRRVEEAFADVVYPGDNNITISECPCEECRETREMFQGRQWREVAEPGQPIANIGWGGLTIMSPEAWRFYLPAYLIISLSGGDNAEEALTCALYNLAPVGTESDDKCFRERVFCFTIAQQACIAAYACTAVESGGDDEAFEVAATYWKSRVIETKSEQGVATQG